MGQLIPHELWLLYARGNVSAIISGPNYGTQLRSEHFADHGTWAGPDLSDRSVSCWGMNDYFSNPECDRQE